MIVLSDVTFAYPREAAVFAGLNWQVAQGQVWSVLGRSGSGKSTLLLLLAGLVKPQSGIIHVQGRRLDRPRPETGLVLQDYGLLPWATLRDNVALGIRVRRLYGPDGRHAPAHASPADHDAQTRVDHWLQRLAIAEVSERRPGQVSGGQRQRAAVARALVLGPDILLLDEPFAALDAPTREGLQSLTLALCRESRLTVVLVTHSIEEAIYVGQHVLLLPGRPGDAVTAFANPHTSDPDYRATRAYATTCARAREALDAS